MHDYLSDPITVLWIIWLVYWGIAAARVKPPVRRESALSRAAHVIPLMLAAFLLLMPHPGNVLGSRLLPWQGSSRYDAGLVLVALGLAFAVWARTSLGRNWSATVTVKQQHELVRSGPYRFVRHPIYTGMLLAFLGTAIAQDQWRSLLAFALVWLALWRKWKLEERFMQDTFGEPYLAYRRQVPAVVPWKWPR
jgi:protein-S-isoprenylcysteine O-methyltransferase Ste14